jgi:hypothetical protein
MKSYTDLEQSKRLAEILPKESADMGWYYSRNPQAARNQMWVGTKSENADIPCWSLTALLDVLIYPHIEQNYMGQWVCRVEQQNTTYLWEGSNPVDACYEMIIKLHELNLL